MKRPQKDDNARATDVDYRNDSKATVEAARNPRILETTVCKNLSTQSRTSDLHIGLIAHNIVCLTFNPMDPRDECLLIQLEY